MAADHVVGSAYFEDKSAQLDFEQASRQEYIPYTGVLNKGYTQSATWLRLRIDPAGDGVNAPDEKRLVLRIRPTYLDEIELFDPMQPTSQRRLVGDRQATGKEEYNSLSYNFVIPGGDAPREVWLRLKTTSTHLIYVEALSFGEIQKADHEQELIYSILLAVLFFFLVWALIHWLPQRERLIGVFLLRQSICFAYTLNVIGYSRILLGDFVPAPWLDNATSLTILSLVSFTTWFDHHLLREFQPSKWLMRLLLVLAALLPFEIALFFAGKASEVLHFNSIVLLIEPLLALLIAFTAKAWKAAASDEAPVISRRGLILFYFTSAAVVMASALIILGIVKAVGPALYNLLVASMSVFSGVIIVVLLQLRASRMEQRRLRVFTQLAISEKQVEQERQQRLEQSKFMAMLTHELKTPLSVLRMVLGNHVPSDELRAHADRAVHDMNNVIERCLQTEKLSDQKLVMELGECRLMDELQELGRNSRAPDRLSINSEIAPLLKTDSQMLRIILANLIDNAMKYSPPESNVQIEVAQVQQPQGDGISITVQNFPGTAGWPDTEKIFQKYYRSKAAHHQTGSGLGLYLAGSMARMLGGEVCYVPDDTFISFNLWLPT